MDYVRRCSISNSLIITIKTNSVEGDLQIINLRGRLNCDLTVEGKSQQRKRCRAERREKVSRKFFFLSVPAAILSRQERVGYEKKRRVLEHRSMQSSCS